MRASPDYGCDRGAERRHTEVYARREKDILSPYKVSNGGGIPDNYVDYTGDDYHFFLTFMPEVQWNVECPHDRTKVSNAENDVQDLHDAQLAMLVISIFTFILITLVGSFIMVKIFQNDDDGTIEEGEDGYEFQQKTLICIIVSMVTAINMAYIFQEISESGEEAAAVCTDVVSASSLSTLSSSITKISNEDIVAGCSSGFDVLMEIIDKVMFC